MVLMSFLLCVTYNELAARVLGGLVVTVHSVGLVLVEAVPELSLV